MASVEEELEHLPAGWEMKYLECQREQDSYSLEFNKKGLTVCARIPEVYPDDHPAIELGGVDWTSMHETMKGRIYTNIINYMKNIHGQPMISMLLDEISDATSLTKITSPKISDAQKQSEKASGPKKKTPKRKKAGRCIFQMGVLAPNFQEPIKDSVGSRRARVTDSRSGKGRNVKKDQKLPSMKTAKDVINRLKWDDHLKNEDFMVGYEDRFTGIIEVPVWSLNWEDDISATGPMDKLAIPEHRIHYFKWNSKLVWDRESRTDHVFGSVGSKWNIVEFMKSHKARIQLESQKNYIPSSEPNEDGAIEGIVVDVKLVENPVRSAWDQFQDSANDIADKGANCSESFVTSSDATCIGVDSSLGDDKERSETEDLKLLPVVADHMQTLRGENDASIFASDDCIDTPDVTVNRDADPMSCLVEDKRTLPVETITSQDLLQETSSDNNPPLSSHQNIIFEHNDERPSVTKSDKEGASTDNNVLHNENTLSDKNDTKQHEEQYYFGDDSSWDNENRADGQATESTEDNFLSAILMADEEDAEHPDHLSCPKDKTSKSKHHKDFRPYNDSPKKEREDKHSKRRQDREKYEKHHQAIDNDRNGNNERVSRLYRYCVAADIDRWENEKLRTLQNQISHQRKSKARFRKEEYLFINIASITFENPPEEEQVKRLLANVCKEMKPFLSSMHYVKLLGRTIVAPVLNEAFRILSKKLSEHQLIGENVQIKPHIPLLQVRGNIRDVDNRRFPSMQLKFLIHSMYLWNIDGPDDQRVEYMDLGDGTDMSWKEEHQQYCDERRSLDSSRQFSSREIRKDSRWEFTVSKTLSAILRHNQMGFRIDKEGYLPVSTILQHQFFRSHNVTESDIEVIVETNAKKRFILDGDRGSYKIRATQGHTVKDVDLHLRKLEDPNEFPNVIHGTKFELFESISLCGLNRMKRNHIHMTTGLPTDDSDVISGMRNSCNCFIYVDVKKAIEDGIEFFVSDNGVILSEGVDGKLESKYFRKVVHRVGGFDREIPLQNQHETENKE